MTIEHIKVREMQEGDIPAVQAFLFTQLQALFNQERGQGAITDDVWGLKETYIIPLRHQLWLAYNEVNQTVVGTIAISQYNDRIKLLKGRYQLEQTAEIGRCYIAPELRCKGIGSRLLAVAEEFCRQHDYHIIYLHTHHFLPGGFHFWRKNNFTIIIDEGGDNQIVHMEKSL